VDDFKMAGPSLSLQAGWKSLREYLKLDQPTLSSNYLGCGHAEIAVNLSDPSWRAVTDLVREHVLPGSAVHTPVESHSDNLRGIQWPMVEFVDQCLNRYCELTGMMLQNIPAADTPGLDDSQLSPDDFVS
jgi:hypothetical protein